MAFAGRSPTKDVVRSVLIGVLGSVMITPVVLRSCAGRDTLPARPSRSPDESLPDAQVAPTDAGQADAAEPVPHVDAGAPPTAAVVDAGPRVRGHIDLVPHPSVVRPRGAASVEMPTRGFRGASRRA